MKAAAHIELDVIDADKSPTSDTSGYEYVDDGSTAKHVTNTTTGENSLRMSVFNKQLLT